RKQEESCRACGEMLSSCLFASFSFLFLFLPFLAQSELKGEERTFAEGAFDANSVLYVRNCENSTFTVNVHSAKVMVVGCKNCKVVMNGKVRERERER